MIDLLVILDHTMFICIYFFLFTRYIDEIFHHDFRWYTFGCFGIYVVLHVTYERTYVEAA